MTTDTLSTNHQTNIITKVILDNDLYLLPLHTIVTSIGTDKLICACSKGSKCSSPGKHPFFRYNWKVIATNSESKINQWFTDYQDKVNFAVATGRKSKTTNKYLVVVDVDKFDHPIIDKLEHTFSYKTGSGGYHFWFWSQLPVKNSVSGLAPKVDIRGKDGYVVIPPSKHKSGDLYVSPTEVKEIADLPQFIVDFIRFAKPTEPKTNKKKTLKVVTKTNWSSMSVKQLRTIFGEDTTCKIPVGSRNSILHRLLSSDRTKGFDRKALVAQSKVYRTWCDDPGEVTRTELSRLVDSVMTYAPYNTKHDNVNLGFFDWKEQRKQGLSEEDKEKIISVDFSFFSSLKQSSCDRVPLSIVSSQRDKVFGSIGIKSYSKYRPQLLAKKLESMGFSRMRTNKGNLWNIDLSGLQVEDSVLE